MEQANTITETTTTAASAAPADGPGAFISRGEEGLGVERGQHVIVEHSYGGQYNTRVGLHKPLARASAEMQPLTAIYLREPKAGDLRGIKMLDLFQSEGEAVIRLLQRICMPRLSPAEAESLSLRDVASISEAIAGFLE